MERLSNGMNRVERLTQWNDPLTEGYFPKLDNILANSVWPSRPANSRLSVIYSYAINNYCNLMMNSTIHCFDCFCSTERQQNRGSSVI